jgi:hypothetical protein
MVAGMMPVEGIHSVALNEKSVKRTQSTMLNEPKNRGRPQPPSRPSVLCPKYIMLITESATAMPKEKNETTRMSLWYGPVRFSVPSCSGFGV